MSIPKTLEDRLKSGKILPFVGAGVSKAVKRLGTSTNLFPDWKQLLEHAAARLVEETKVTEAEVVRALLKLSPSRYLDAAKHARDGMGASVWFSYLAKQLVRNRDEAEEASLELAKAVWGLGSRLIITTNYDHVLSWACPTGQPSAWDIEARAEMAAALRGEISQNTVWHLHGTSDNVSRLILSPDGYRQLYPDGQTEATYKAALETLRTNLASRTFLFIGFSLDDLRFVEELKRTHSIFDGAAGPHYVLIHASEEPHIKSLGLPVETISFSDFGQPLVNLVRELGALATPATSAPVAASPAPQHMCDVNNSVFYVPFNAKGNQVIGREGALEAVRKQLADGHRTAIGHTAAFQGLGGLGKTQLAVEYAHTYRDSYPKGVIWLTADQDIDAQLTDLAVKANWIDAASEHKYKLDVAKHRLNSFSDCLIIFDNLEDIAAIEDYLPEPPAQPHILVTSRTPHRGFVPIALDVLSADDSLKLLLQEAGRTPQTDVEWEAAREIANALGGLPLALEMAGAYLCYLPVPWPTYAELLRRNLKAALAGDFCSSFTKHQADIYSTLKIDEDLIQSKSLLKPILDLLTWSGASTMGLSLMAALLDNANPGDLEIACALGVSLRLLQKDPKEERFAIHRLLREVRREEIPLEQSTSWVDKVCQRIGTWFVARREKFEDLPAFEAEIDHLRAWQEIASTHSASHLAQLVWLQAYPPYHRGRYHESKAYLERAQAVFGSTESRDQLLQARLLQDLGAISLGLGDDMIAMSFLRESLSIYKTEFPGDQHDQARCLAGNAQILMDMESFPQAEKLMIASRDMFRRLYGERNDNTLTREFSLCVIRGRMGRYRIALERANELLQTSSSVFGEESLITAQAHNVISVLCGESGDFGATLSHSLTQLKVLRKIVGLKHPRTAICLYNVGGAYQRLGRSKEALLCLKDAYAIQLEMLGAEHNETVDSQLEIGEVLYLQKDIKGARHELESAVEICRKRGFLNRTAVKAHIDLARLMDRLGLASEAYPVLKNFFDRYPKEFPAYIRLRDSVHALQQKAQRPGFRQRSAKKGR
ncbi:MAG TPA: tetratricopeptide repeat protein [bacterium]|jgi:tetratricopeptide (TPR) repeat protein